MSDARWFKTLGSCLDCSKPAVGTLMNSRNSPLGTYCKRHGEAHIRRAQKAATTPRTRTHVHNWRYEGHGHNYSVYRCTKCGTTEER